MPSGDRRLEISLDGKVDDTLLDDLIQLEVSDEEGEHPQATLTMVMRKLDSGDWTHADTSGSETTFSLWQRLRVRSGFGSDLQVVFDGYISGISPHFTPDESTCSLTVWAYGASFAMDQEEKQVRWEDKTFSQVATAILESYGLKATVDDTVVQYMQDDVTLLQRGTDWEFLRGLAFRVGYECFVEGADGYFRKPVIDSPVQHDIALHFGPSATNAVWFRPCARAGFPTTVALQRLDTKGKTTAASSVEASPLPALGKTDSKGVLGGRQSAGSPTLLAFTRPVTSTDELTALGTGLRQDLDWFSDGEGELDGNLYGVVLRAHRPVNIKGAGTAWSGTWYVRRVHHSFTPTTYRQRFHVVRNRMGQSGSESFQAVTDQSSAVSATSVVTVQTADSGQVVSP